MIDQRFRQGWQLEGTGPEAYERYLLPAFFRAQATELAGLATPQVGERVLDVACGTGIVARVVAPHVGPSGRVVGLDVNPGMLAVAREASHGLAPEIEWQEGNALSLPFSDRSFDLVFCEQALQFFSDRPQALAEMRRVLARGGRLALSVCRGLDHNRGYAALADALQRRVSSEAGDMMRSPFALGDADELRALATGAGFRDVRVRVTIGTARYPSVEELVWQEAASSPLAPWVVGLDERTRDDLIADVAAGVRSYVDDDGVALPLEVHVVLARA